MYSGSKVLDVVTLTNSFALQERPIISELKVSKDIGPRIKVAPASHPRVSPILSPSAASELPQENGYAIVGPPTSSRGDAMRKKPGTGWQENRDSGYIPGSSSTSVTSESPASNHSPRQQGTKHFIFNTSPQGSALRKNSDHIYALPPDCIESVYVTPSEMDSSDTLNHTYMTALDHTYADPDATVFEEVEEKDDAVLETKFDDENASTVATNASDTQSISTVNSQDHLMTVEHIQTERGELYAVVSKESPTNGKHTPEDGKSVEDEHSRTLTNIEPNLSSTTAHDDSVATLIEGPPVCVLQLLNTKAEQTAELKKLPSIKQKKLELERRMRGEEDENSTKSPNGSPPPIPRRQSKVSIPEVLQNKPLPPPMSTHPGLLRKAEEEKLLMEQQQQQEQQPPKEERKKKSFRLKKRDSKKEKQKAKEREKTDKRQSIHLEEPPVEDHPVPLVHRMSGATPMVGDIQETELQNKFKNITKQQWNTSTFEVPPPSATQGTTTHTSLSLDEPTVMTFLPSASAEMPATSSAVSTAQLQVDADRVSSITTRTTTSQTTTTQAASGATSAIASQSSCTGSSNAVVTVHTDTAPVTSVSQISTAQAQTSTRPSPARGTRTSVTAQNRPPAQVVVQKGTKQPSQTATSAPATQTPSNNLINIVPGVQPSVLQAPSSWTSSGPQRYSTASLGRRQVSAPSLVVAQGQQRYLPEEPIVMGPMNFKRTNSLKKRKSLFKKKKE